MRSSVASPASRPVRSAGPSVIVGLVVALLTAGCGSETSGSEPGTAPDRTTSPTAHLAACVEDAPEEPCDPLPPYDAGYWLAQSEGRTGAYLDAAALCLGALLDGAVVGRRGACVDVHAAYVAEARAGRRDLDGRLDQTQAARAFGLAYSAVVAERSRRSADRMGGRGDDPGSALGAPSPDSLPRP